jgi:hypothetical protein
MPSATRKGTPARRVRIAQVSMAIRTKIEHRERESICPLPRIVFALSTYFGNIPTIHRVRGYPMAVFIVGAGTAGIVLGVTNRIVFLLPAALMALVIASVLIVRADLDVAFTALTASVFSGGYLLGVVMANTRPRFFTR